MDHLHQGKVTSDYRGIRWHKCNRKWEVQIKYRGKKLSLGYFDDELVAAQCYDRRAKELYETPLLNFLPGGKLNPERKRRVDPRSLRPRRIPPPWCADKFVPLPPESADSEAPRLRVLIPREGGRGT
ncbi:homing endonuclease rb16 2, partial [Nannochloropsis gaditana CCMP526]|uniref:homing endonuclease rb16 2 n=1 Tax=Nannochloropsis gaditana (strain CCMP526) TaxID=1093141 RepID=UPI00029F5124